MDIIQQINLYHPPEEAPPPKLSFKRMTQVVGGIAVALVLVQIVFFTVTYMQKSKLARMQEESATLRAELLSKSRELNVVSDESILNKEIVQLQGVYANKQKAIMILRNQGLDNTKGFSDYFSALARNRVDGAWLTKIYIEKGGQTIDLEGQASDPEMIPHMLSALESEGTFNDKSFKIFGLNRRDDKTVSFNIETGKD